MFNKGINFTKKHIKENILLYSLVILCFLIGISVGAFTVKIVDKHQKEQLVYYLKDFFQLFYNSELNNFDILKQSFFNNFQLITFNWILGALIITFPLVLCIIGFKGFIIGFTAALLIEEFKFWGILLFLFGILPQNIIIISVFIVASVISISFAIEFIKTKLHKSKKVDFTKMFFLYSGIYGLFMVLILISSSIEAYIVSKFIQLLVKGIL